MMQKPRSIFESATLRLTAWYMVLLLVLALFFSVIVFNLASHEFERAAGPRMINLRFTDDERSLIEQSRLERIEASNRSLITNLIVFNILTLVSGGLLSYWLARRTLRPIEDAMEAQNRFTSDAAHELRTPLAIMQSEIEVALRQQKPRSAVYADTLQSNLDEVHRLQTLTERLLLLSNVQPLPVQEIDIEHAAIEAMQRAIPSAQQKKISIENNVTSHSARGNEAYLTDALGVLLDNAIKFSPAKSRVRMTSEQRDSHILIHVIDEGIGIAQTDIPHIFDRFYRADQSRSRQNIEGYGLGLSLAKRLVTQQHGDLTVTSTVDHGSTFTISLPKK